MEKEALVRAFSERRVEPYYKTVETEKEGFDKFNKNKTLSTIFYNPLSVFEVVLRNAVTKELSSQWRTFNSLEAWQAFLKGKTSPNKTFTDTANDQLMRLAKEINKERVGNPESLEKLKTQFPSLGFYVRFFHTKNTTLFSKAITVPMFKKCKGISREQRITTQERAYKDFIAIQNLRNRIYHYESLKNFSSEKLIEASTRMYFYVEIINPDAYCWLEKKKPLKTLVKEIKKYSFK